MAAVAKSTIAPGQKRIISRISAPVLTDRCGSPTAGLVFWHEDTGPQKTVAQEGNNTSTSNNRAMIRVVAFFIV
jgi:hypothetical protein